MKRHFASVKFVGIFILLFLASYIILSALWSSILLSVSQSDSIIFYVQNVVNYLVTIPNHLMGIMFDLPFDLVKEPLYLLLAFVTGVILILTKGKIKKLKTILPVILIVSALLSFIIFFLTHPGCIDKYDGCMQVRYLSPMLVGLSGLIVMSVWPLVITINKKNYLIQLLKFFLFGVVWFSLIWFLAVFLPIRENVLATERFHQQNAKQKIESIKSRIDYLDINYSSVLPKIVGPQLSQQPGGSSIVTTYACGQTQRTGLIITQQRSESIKVGPKAEKARLPYDFPNFYSSENVYGNIYQTALTFFFDHNLVTIKFDPECQPQNVKEELEKIANLLLV